MMAFATALGAVLGLYRNHHQADWPLIYNIQLSSPNNVLQDGR